MMLRHLGLDHHANQIASAVYKVRFSLSLLSLRQILKLIDSRTQVIADGKVKTPDMGGKDHTSDFTFAVIKGELALPVVRLESWESRMLTSVLNSAAQPSLELM